MPFGVNVSAACSVAEVVVSAGGGVGDVAMVAVGTGCQQVDEIQLRAQEVLF